MFYARPKRLYMFVALQLLAIPCNIMSNDSLHEQIKLEFSLKIHAHSNVWHAKLIYIKKIYILIGGNSFVGIFRGANTESEKRINCLFAIQVWGLEFLIGVVECFKVPD